MTSNFVAEANKLKTIQMNLERSETIFLDHLTKQEGGSEVKELWKELKNARAKDLDVIQNEIRHIYSPLQILRDKIEESVQNIDLTMLKKDMISAQSNIQNMRYKHKVMLEKLEKEEKVLLAEMHAFEEKLAKWDSRPSVLQCTTTVPKKPENMNYFCQEVVDFFKFATDSGGHDGGWPHDDHNLFIKIRSRYKSPKQMANCFHALCPDLSVDEILKHEEWYKKYLDLKDKQKEAIKAWRENKNKELAKQSEDKEEKTTKTVTFAHIKKETKDDVQDKIDKWKKQKEERKLSEQEAKKGAERKQKESEEKKKKEAWDLKMEIKHWKHSKVVQDHEDKIKKELSELREKEFRVANSKKLIKQFQSQDDFFIQRMKRSRKPKRSKSLERPRKSNAPRDPERLLKPTKQWIFRTMPRRDDDETPPEPKQVCNVRFVQKLGIPMWRKCM